MLLGNGSIAFDTKVIRSGMREASLWGIMLGVGKATYSRGESARAMYFSGDGQRDITETGCFEHR